MKKNFLNHLKLSLAILTFGFMAFTFNACSSKEEAPPAQQEEEVQDIPTNSVKSIAYPGIWKADFHYLAGKLDAISWDNGDTSALTYDGDYLTNIDRAGYPVAIDYNKSTGQILEHSFGSGGNAQRIEYTYSGNEEQPSGFIWYSNKYENSMWVEKKTYEMTEITYNSEGGLVSAKGTNYSGGAIPLTITFDLENKENALYGNIPFLALPQFIMGDYGFTKLSKQYVKQLNVTRTDMNLSWEVKFNYAYDSEVDHLISKITLTPDSSPTERLFEWNK